MGLMTPSTSTGTAIGADAELMLAATETTAAQITSSSATIRAVLGARGCARRPGLTRFTIRRSGRRRGVPSSPTGLVPVFAAKIRPTTRRLIQIVGGSSCGKGDEAVKHLPWGEAGKKGTLKRSGDRKRWGLHNVRDLTTPSRLTLKRCADLSLPARSWQTKDFLRF